MKRHTNEDKSANSSQSTSRPEPNDHLLEKIVTVRLSQLHYEVLQAAMQSAGISQLSRFARRSMLELAERVLNHKKK